jgi:hypothetical protein
MKTYLTTTFSPAMVARGTFHGHAVSLDEARKALEGGFISAVSHEVTAPVLAALLGVRVEFARINLALGPGDRVVVVVPRFRAEVAREFTRDEVEAAGFSAYIVDVVD